MAAQRAAGEAFCDRVKAQLRPSALRPSLPAAKAALDAEMQMRSGRAAMISMVSRMAAVLPRCAMRGQYTPVWARGDRNHGRLIRPGPCIKIVHASHKPDPPGFQAARNVRMISVSLTVRISSWQTKRSI